MISIETATDIAVIYRDIKAAEELLDQVRKAIDQFEQVDIRDVFGRRQQRLEMGIPRGEASRTILHVPYQLAIPVIEATIASHQAKLKVLNEKARIEIADEHISKPCLHLGAVIDEATGVSTCRDCGLLMGARA